MAILSEPEDFVCGVSGFDDRERAEAGCFSERVKFGGSGTGPAAALLDELARMLPVAPPNGLTKMMSALGRPAFRRYLEARKAGRSA